MINSRRFGGTQTIGDAGRRLPLTSGIDVTPRVKSAQNQPFLRRILHYAYLQDNTILPELYMIKSRKLSTKDSEFP